MGVGFIITIILLACLLGVFSRQALASTEENLSNEAGEREENASHQDAM